MFDHLSDSARDWRASKTFSEIVRMSVDKVHALESIAAKLDEMLPHYAPPIAPEPVYVLGAIGDDEPAVLLDDTLKMFKEREAQPTRGAIVKMAKELLAHRAKLTTVSRSRDHWYD